MDSATRPPPERSPELHIVGDAPLAEPGDLGHLYTAEQFARIQGVPPRRVRAWVRHGLIRPARVVRRLLLFEFRQLATARALARLGAAGVRPAEIRASLERLGTWLAEGEEALSQLEALESGRLLVVRTPEGLAEPDGQLRLDFEAREQPARGSAPPRAPVLAPDWFEAGAESEEAGRFEDAVEAYVRAAEAHPARPEVRFNLANALYTLERKADAVQALLAAVELDPEYVEAWNNLGNIMADVGEIDEALACFARALELEPGYADAHYNLAEVLANEGDYAPAREHWRAYLAADPTSPTADAVRERLARTAKPG
jgi:tetratricopeptide (TPR) repeat protein